VACSGIQKKNFLQIRQSLLGVAIYVYIKYKLKSRNILQHTQPGKLTYTVTNNPNIVKQEVISEEMLYHVTNKPQNVQYVTSPEPVQYTVSNV
jgi:hypothetical protein